MKKQMQGLLVILFVTAGLLKCLVAVAQTRIDKKASTPVKPGQNLFVSNAPVDCY